ncbi:aldo/keto reductase [Pararhodobacter sp.]|uniref:aldo/keto reductase n=1 Tax=Pararhodobacter sp. TaxID=2127056 RepID=UPI002AFF7B17|nr:aldo/keto reductase [Pararhodobacter sp.]
MTHAAFDEQRRRFISTSMVVAYGAAVAGSGLVGSARAQAAAGSAPSAGGPLLSGQRNARRKLGQLEVSSIGLGVQNMARSYQTTIPARPEMINIIRTAYERGVTFFDTAEAYGPHECEHILGEAITPFRDKVAITSKFGFNIDLQTGARRAG